MVNSTVPNAPATAKKKRLPPGSSLEARLHHYIEKVDGCWTWTGKLNQSGYGRLLVDRRTVLVHRISWELANGPVPDGFVIDHICHNRACVNPNHLRVATRKQNSENRQGAQANNHATGVRGVHPGRKPGTWYAALKDNYKQMHIGTFHSIEDADAAVRAERAQRYTLPDAI